MVKRPCCDVYSLFLIAQTKATLTFGGEDTNSAGPLNLQLASNMFSIKCVTLGAKIFEMKISCNPFRAKPSLNTEAVLANC